MAKTTRKFLSRQQLITALEAVVSRAEKQNDMPLHFEFDGDMLILLGSNNLGQPDDHNLVRVDDTIAYSGPVDVQGHLCQTSILTKGEESDIRIKGYITGASEKDRVTVVAEDASIILGDPGHPERKLIMYAHIEAGAGINIYKRQLVHTQILNHQDDAIIRGQNILHSVIKSPALNINTSMMLHTKIETQGDAMLKCSEVANCHINAEDGDVYLCSGRTHNTIIHAKYDIEINGCVDEFTLRNARSEKGVIRHDGVEVGRKAAPQRAAAKKMPRKVTAAAVGRASAKARKTGS